MRALAGNYINKGGKKEAFVARCEDLKPTDIMEYNGKNMTWTEFQEYWKDKPAGAWLYDDAVDTPENKSRFENAWLLAGPDYCQKNGLEYVDYNQKHSQMLTGGVHFIFALDESGSMGGSPWEELMQAFRKTLSDIVNYSTASTNNKVSVINFASNFRIIYER